MKKLHATLSNNIISPAHLLPIFAVLVLSIDIGLIIVYVLYLTFDLTREALNLTKDWSAGEVYQYIKETWVVLLLLIVASKHKNAGYVSWAALFAYILLDDAASIHEKSGAYFSMLLGYNDVTTMNHVELFMRSNISMILPAIICSIIFSAIALCYYRGTITFKQHSRILLCLFAILAFFSVLIDSIAYVVGHEGFLAHTLNTIEDGGEMITMSFIYLTTLRFWLEDN